MIVERPILASDVKSKEVYSGQEPSTKYKEGLKKMGTEEPFGRLALEQYQRNYSRPVCSVWYKYLSSEPATINASIAQSSNFQAVL